MNYKKVYFRINTPIYYKSQYGVGFKDQEDRELFNKTISNIFINNGWELKEKTINGSCATVIKDKQELYLHPQSISGVVLVENIPHIEDLLSNSEIFILEATDIYEDVFDLSDEEYLNILKSKKLDIENDILEGCKTKRSNLYITNTYGVFNNVLNKYKVKRLSHYIGTVSNSDIDVQYIKNLFENLVKENKIVTAKTKNGTGYRTDKKFLK